MKFLYTLLLKILGVKVPAGTTLLWPPKMAFHGPIHWGWILLVLVLMSAFVIWSYQRSASHVSVFRRYTMAFLRIAFLLLLFLILLRPVLALTLEGSIRRTLIILVDGTLSMETTDPRAGSPDDLKRAAIAEGMLDPGKGLDQRLPSNDSSISQPKRLDLLKAVLKNDKMKLLPRLAQDYDLRVYSFGTNSKSGVLTPLTTSDEKSPAPSAPDSDSNGPPAPRPPSFKWIDTLRDNSLVTPIGDAIREAGAETRGLPRAGIVLMTDGGNNSGSDPLIVAQQLSSQEGENLPIYAYGIGMSSPKDIIVANMFGPEVSFVKDEVAVTVRVRGQNVAGVTAPLKLMLGDGKTETQVDSKDVVFGPDGEQVISLKFTPQKAGDFELHAFIPPLADEASKTNNDVREHLRVVDGKIKVLLVDRQPRWEFENIQAQLLRDRRVELKCVLFEADPNVSSAPGSPYLPQFPENKQDLFKYDMIIFGDVDPKTLSAAQLDSISEFVAKFGGGFLMIAGKQFAPNAYHGTPIEKMLPVDIDLNAAAGIGFHSSADAVADKPIHLELTEKGKQSRMLELSDKPSESAARWAQLPPIYWDARVSKAKPAAQVLMVDPDQSKASRFGKMPVLALQQYGLGQVMFLGTDNTWRWRKNRGDQFYLTLWGQMVQRMSLPHLLGASKRTQLSSDKETYTAGEKVTIYARLYGENYDPVSEPKVLGYYGNGTATDTESTNDREVVLKAQPDQPGQYRGEFIAPAGGSYKFHVDKPGDPKVFLDFTTVQPLNEPGDTAMNESLLRDMSKASGGAFFREEDLNKLPDTIQLKSERVRSPLEVELWSTPLYFILLMSVVTAEWILRKLSQLK